MLQIVLFLIFKQRSVAAIAMCPPDILEHIDVFEYEIMSVIDELFDNAELIGHDVPASRIRALPSSLKDLKYDRASILHYRVVDSARIDPF